jgi:hypothetical protein
LVTVAIAVPFIDLGPEPIIDTLGDNINESLLTGEIVRGADNVITLVDPLYPTTVPNNPYEGLFELVILKIDPIYVSFRLLAPAGNLYVRLLETSISIADSDPVNVLVYP